jgi:beta-galactosidase
MSFLHTKPVSAAQANHKSPVVIGAEVFIEPGQTDEEIELWFRKMNENGMKLCRIRVFEDYMKRSDGTWDFTLYDKAFRAGEKYDVQIFATLFPYSPGNTIGGFKFPLSQEHEEQIRIYIEETVNHFKDFRSLYGWVLMNEPGTGGSLPQTAYTEQKFSEWKEKREMPANNSKGYTMLKKFEEEKFLVDYNTWYLDWIAQEIARHDTGHHIHVNNHQIFENIAEYDFPAWRKFLNSLGASAHPSWHFSYFTRPQYTVALSANCNIIRSGAGNLPFMVTELQGGNNTYSGKDPFCPTREETLQWLWTSIATGADGIIFWSLNPRSIGEEAGEWALLDFQNHESDRMLAAAEVAEFLERNHALFARAKPLESNVNILYNRESLWIEKEVQYGNNNNYEGRQPGGVIKSALAYYEILSENGIVPNLKEFNEFDWSKGDYGGVSIILANQVSLPSGQWDNIRNFVKKGGKLFVEGLTGFYDENMFSLFNTGFPLQDVFGGTIREIKCIPGDFEMTVKYPLIAHLWKGYIYDTGGEVLSTENEYVTATRNRFGKGETVWIPSLMGLGARRNGNGEDLSKLLLEELNPQVPVRFDQYEKGLFMQTMYNGKSYLSVVINKSGEKKDVKIHAPGLKARIVFPDNAGKITDNQLSIHPEETIVLEWR